MRILLTGLVSVHMGRIEFGNIGNYYIVETTIRELHRVFPDAEIVTTFQMTEGFAKREKVTVLPLDIYYTWAEKDLIIAYQEYFIASIFNETKCLVETTPFIEEVNQCDLVCDFSGEMWGDHAEPVGKDRFLVNLLKMRVAQLLGKPTVLLAGSQGPFDITSQIKPFAKLVFKNYTLVANREAASGELLRLNGFDISNLKSYTDPAFLFEPATQEQVEAILKRENIVSPHKKTVGLILCGFNMLEGPYDKEPRRDEEFSQFADLVEYLVNALGVRVCLMSHSNGFEKSPAIKLINGRDYPYAKRLYDIVAKSGHVDMDNVICAQGPFSPKETKAIIKNFDMFISGRIHAFVAAASQCVPTVIITRGHGGKSHRNIGFARSVGLEEFISDPASSLDMIEKAKQCWENRMGIRKTLERKIPYVQETAHELFNSLSGIF